MNKGLKERWVKALRSGEFQQTTGKLRMNTTEDDGLEREAFCCLGVLGVLNWPQEWDNDMLMYESEDGGPDRAEGELPACLLQEIGLTYDEQSTLIKMNDGTTFNGAMSCKKPEDELPEPGETINHTRYVKDKSPQTFEQIADYIEEHL